MRLDSIPFIATQKALKRIEIRLNDEKRRKLKAGDLIEFENTNTYEKMIVRIKEIRLYESMTRLASCESFDKTGGIYMNREHWIKSINSYYNKADQEKYGLMSIEIELT